MKQDKKPTVCAAVTEFEHPLHIEVDSAIVPVFYPVIGVDEDPGQETAESGTHRSGGLEIGYAR